MKKKNINADAALQEVERRHHTTVEEVRKEIRLAMIAAMCNPDPAVQKRWREIPHTGDTITPEDLITYIAKQCLPQRAYALVMAVTCRDYITCISFDCFCSAAGYCT